MSRERQPHPDSSWELNYLVLANKHDIFQQEAPQPSESVSSYLPWKSRLPGEGPRRQADVYSLLGECKLGLSLRQKHTRVHVCACASVHMHVRVRK